MRLINLWHISIPDSPNLLVKEPSTRPANGQEVGGARRNMGGVEETRLLKLNDFLFISHLDNVNFFKVLRYCQRSQISKKVRGELTLNCVVIVHAEIAN